MRGCMGGREYLTRPDAREATRHQGCRGLIPIKGFGASAFPPIGDYAFLSDCETTALVAPSGNVEWLCWREDGLAERVRLDARAATPAASG